MDTSLLLTAVLFLACAIFQTQAEFYRLSNQSYDYTVIKEVNTGSVFTCLILCNLELSCHTFFWKDTYSSCFLVGRKGTTLLSSVVASSLFYTSQNNANITVGITGTANGSNLENAFSVETSVFYQSANAASFTNTIDFRVTFPKPIIVTSFQLTLINISDANQNLTDMHWHTVGTPFCESSLPYPRPTGVLLSFDCPNTTTPIRTALLHLGFQGSVAFNHLKIIGPDQFALYP